MKRTGYMTLAAVALVLMSLVPAYAQLKTSATVNIPFSFTVDDVRMPAGEYLITSPSEKVISIQRVGGPEVETTMISNNDGHKGDHSPRLIFRRYSSEYFLATAFLPGQDHAHEFVASAAEIQVARTTPQKTYELAMNVAK
jgi:hypothetical protein